MLGIFILFSSLYKFLDYLRFRGARERERAGSHKNDYLENDIIWARAYDD